MDTITMEKKKLEERLEPLFRKIIKIDSEGIRVDWKKAIRAYRLLESVQNSKDESLKWPSKKSSDEDIAQSFIDHLVKHNVLSFNPKDNYGNFMMYVHNLTPFEDPRGDLYFTNEKYAKQCAQMTIPRDLPYTTRLA